MDPDPRSIRTFFPVRKDAMLRSDSYGLYKEGRFSTVGSSSNGLYIEDLDSSDLLVI
jgi:hypothetical protein